MNIEEIRDYCLAKPGVTEGFTFGEDVLVFSVMNKLVMQLFNTLAGNFHQVSDKFV